MVKKFLSLLTVMSLLVPAHSFGKDSKPKPHLNSKKVSANPSPLPPTFYQSKYRGWDYLVARLLKDGITPKEIAKVYLNPRMPPLGYVPFKLAPKEGAHMYRHFQKKERLDKARLFLSANKKTFREVAKRYGVSPAVVCAILLVETHFGEHVGEELVINRLSRVASVGSSENIEYNLLELQKEDPSVTLEQVIKRADYLEKTFYPEVPALFEIARRRKINPIIVKGSYGGAFGLSQFLPTSFLNYGVDFNGDGAVSLFTVSDAVASTANFLKHAGWKNDLTIEEKRRVIWRYNRSDAYIDTVLQVASELDS